MFKYVKYSYRICTKVKLTEMKAESAAFSLLDNNYGLKIGKAFLFLFENVLYLTIITKVIVER